MPQPPKCSHNLLAPCAQMQELRKAKKLLLDSMFTAFTVSFEVSTPQVGVNSLCVTQAFFKRFFNFLHFFLADIGTCAITAIPFEKSKVLFGLEEMEEFSVVDETDPSTVGDLSRSMTSLEKWGWIMFECGIENLTVKGTV